MTSSIKLIKIWLLKLFDLVMIMRTTTKSSHNLCLLLLTFMFRDENENKKIRQCVGMRGKDTIMRKSISRKHSMFDACSCTLCDRSFLSYCSVAQQKNVWEERFMPAGIIETKLWQLTFAAFDWNNILIRAEFELPCYDWQLLLTGDSE